MKITAVETKPLRLSYKEPFHWAQGVVESADVVLISVHTDAGIIGYGESLASAASVAVPALLRIAQAICIGHSPFDINRLTALAYERMFAARGNLSAPRFGAMVLAGLDMALWDVAGKAAGLAVHDLLGGALRDHIQYFGFPQGDSAGQVAAQARQWADSGSEVIYAKIGRGEQLDLDIAASVRAAIGTKRLRLDANEAWDVLTARRMIKQLAAYDVEFIEQPTKSSSLAALCHTKAHSPVAIAADQLVFGPADVYGVCQGQAADLIVLGLHETGGISGFIKSAAIAEVAGLNVCLHGLYESGITTCASNQVGAVLSNLDDGNQYMNHFLTEDIITKPDLQLRRGRLPILRGPGLGFELDWDAVARAEESFRLADHDW